MTTAQTPEELERARRLLEEAGFRVSEAPISWREFSVIVTIKVQSPDFSEKVFVDDITSLLAPAYETRTRIASRIGSDIRQYTGPVVKRYSRVRPQERDDV